jgi:rod shape-determining protein MreC
LPPELLIGAVVRDVDGRLRLRLAADYERLEFVRVLQYRAPEGVADAGSLILGSEPLPPRIAEPLGEELQDDPSANSDEVE